MEDTTSTEFTAVDSQSPNCDRNELKDPDNIADCQQQHQTMQRTGGNGRWCTSSVRSRSSTSFLIHNLLISCSGDVSATTSPPSRLMAGRRDGNEDDGSSSSGESKSRSCSPPESQPSSPAMDVNGEKDDDDVDGIYGAADRYRVKRRKCALPFRRRTAKKKDCAGTNDASGGSDDDSDKKESKDLHGHHINIPWDFIMRATFR